MAVTLPILIPAAAAGQRYSCHGCGNCCRDFTVQLREEDLGKLREQRWEERLGEPVTVEFRGRTFLRQRDDGACIFWQQDGRCRIHAEHGFEAKPIACQLFPFSFAPGHDALRVGVNFACQSVLENKGAALESHRAEIRRMLGEVPEARASAGLPALKGPLRADEDEVRAFEQLLDGWMAQREDGQPVDLAMRLDGLAWLVQMLGAANFEKVRGERCVELLQTLADAAPLEIDPSTGAAAEPAGRGAWRMLRQAVFARIEDVKVGEAVRQGRLRGALGQLLRSRRFSRGRGPMPHRLAGWPNTIDLAAVPGVGPATEPAEAAAIDDLLTRWVRSTILGGRAWGSGYYGWSLVDGTSALLLNLLATLWLARAHAAGHGRSSLTVIDVRAALGRVDRHAGRAPWLGSGGETLRLRYLHTVGAWRGLMEALQPTRPASPGALPTRTTAPLAGPAGQ